MDLTMEKATYRAILEKPIASSDKNLVAPSFFQGWQTGWAVSHSYPYGNHESKSKGTRNGGRQQLLPPAGALPLWLPRPIARPLDSHSLKGAYSHLLSGLEQFIHQCPLVEKPSQMNGPRGWPKSISSV